MATRINATTSADEATVLAAQGLQRRSLLRLAVSGGTLATLGPLANAQSASPKRGGTLVIGADADPIGLDPVTTSAYSRTTSRPCCIRAYSAGTPT